MSSKDEKIKIYSVAHSTTIGAKILYELTNYVLKT